MNPSPNITPVINLLKLFDIIINNNCVVPSKINGIINIKHITSGIKKPKINSINEHKYPTRTPVQRAHNGNWYPCTKKLLSGF